jgi:NAD(P)H-dependent FMN reductase
LGVDAKLYSLENLDLNQRSPSMMAFEQEALIPTQKFIIIAPEYNGSYPGILKLFIDACSVRAYKESFHGGKKASLMGISSGRAGNLRGMEHFTGVLNYLHISVMPPHQPISNIEKLLDESGIVQDADTLKAMENHIRKFIQF